MEADKLYYYLIKEGIDFKNRRLYLFADVDSDTVSTMVKAINHFNDEDSDLAIEIYIRTDGGVVEDMFSLYDAIRTSKAPIHTFGSGGVASAGVLILAAGHSRWAYENCWLMHHLSKQVTEGDEREIFAQAEANQKLAASTYKLLARHTKKTAKTWEREATKKGEVWLNAEEMMEWGIIDEIIPSPGPPRKKASKKRKKK